MKMNRKSRLLAALTAGGIIAAISVYAMVGEQISKSLSGTVKLPTEWTEHPEAEHAFVKYLRYYVPAQAADGTATVVKYNTTDGTEVKTRDVAKPMISAFMYGPAYVPEGAGGYIGHGRRDVFGALSLDDGSTWRQTNLSDSAALSSIDTITLNDPGDTTKTITAFPGDVVNVVQAVAGNKVVVAWPSRYCKTGSPGYAMDDETRSTVATHLGVDLAKDLYLTDMFGVAGNQGKVNYAALKKDPVPSVGEVPYNCLWSARGVMMAGDDPRTADVAEKNHIVWYKAERLTSGVRDVNRVEIDMVAGAGPVIIWQEDPDGLRPGAGEGPGEGWSGATAGSQTDVWYSFLPWANFETVSDAEGKPVDLTTYWATSTEKPQHYVPFAVPMRLTNNAKCLAAGTSTSPYCYGATALPYGLKDQCKNTVTVGKGQGGETQSICVSASGLPNLANTAATRPRVSLRPRLDSAGNTIGAWVVVINEEDKGLGNFGYLTSAPATSLGTCDPDASKDDDCVKADDGKNIWYHSFDMGKPQTSLDTTPTGLIANLVSQGNLVNQPETDWRTGKTFPVMNTADMWNFEGFNFDIYRTEIARRGSLMVQPETNANLGGSKLMAMLLFKQGLVNQGGPADIMARRIINAGMSANPYDFSNLVCADTRYTDGKNPYYPKGVCIDPAVNLSGTTPQTCSANGDLSDGTCPTISTDGIASSDPEDQQVFDKMGTWIQCPGSPECDKTALSTALGTNLDDQSWHNPLDVAKGHRGYLWGDMAVVMYAWSPNWKLNAVGHDRYELYIRRSFDGGRTWTTTPANWGGKGTQTCETMRDGDTAATATKVCTPYLAGAPEQARNVSQLQSADGTGTYKFTILDPRYAPDPPTMPSITGDGTDPTSDVFNPSRFMVVYEVGDNTTTTEGEPEPLDLWYGRAVNFGDHYQVTSEEATLVNSGAVFNNEFARLTTGSGVAAEEASLAMTPAGDTLYSVWAQVDGTGLSEARFARVWYTDGSTVPTTVPTDPTDEPVMGNGGTGGNGNGSGNGNGNGGGNGKGGGNGGGVGGCTTAIGDYLFDPMLPLIALFGLIGLGLRRARRS